MKNSLAFKLSRKVFERADCWEIARGLKAARVAGAPTIRTYTSRSELHALYKLAAACPEGSTALEIGSYLGASTCYIAAGLAHNNSTLICVDTWGNETMPDGERDTFAEFKAYTEGVKDRIRLIRKPSDQVTDTDINAKLGFIFIDGDHGYAAAKADFARFSAALADNGVIALHDHACYKGVVRALGEALATERWIVAGAVENLIWIRPGQFAK